MALFSKAFDWLSKIVPSHTIHGTPSGDTLDAGAERDIVRGLGGDDVLSSSFNRTALLGDGGNDTLTTDVTAISAGTTPVRGIVAQLGGTGDDLMTVSLAVSGQQASADVLMDGGSGNDRIKATASIAIPGNEADGRRQARDLRLRRKRKRHNRRECRHPWSIRDDKRRQYGRRRYRRRSHPCLCGYGIHRRAGIRQEYRRWGRRKRLRRCGGTRPSQSNRAVIEFNSWRARQRCDSCNQLDGFQQQHPGRDQ